MKLTADEKAMLDGSRGKAHQKAMELLVRYGKRSARSGLSIPPTLPGCLARRIPFWRGISRSLATGTTSSIRCTTWTLTRSCRCHNVSVNSCHLQGGTDPENWQTLGMKPEQLRISQAGEAGAERLGIKILKTCTPYLAGNVPKRGEHCAWMESSAVVYCNSVLGARTNTEGRESTSAADDHGEDSGLGLPSR